ncbi:cation:proton antiporter [Candidatus Micrarchaeota archaeon]|nr:cation:proton antiporter [Candidatus Micrarchaeota archaeon]MBU1166481.1 cation:proton antiporter [Candidatus Micrarchaeota archaeon]MBU1886187.1 cation:proton antiporter [Candidatus Micrarchaeota archaeon]
MKNTINKILPLLVLGIFLLMLLTIVKTSLFGEVEDGKHIYFEIVFLLLLAVGGQLVVAYSKQPYVMALMFLGILISPSFMTIAFDFLHTLPLPFELPPEPPDIFKLENTIHVFAQLGAVILLFKVGLHNKIEKVFASENIMIAIAGVAVPFVVGYGYALFAGGNFAYAVFLGAALTATSVGVTVAILKEMKLINERFSQIIIGAAIVDDILGLLVLSLAVNITGGGEILVPIITTLVSAIIFIGGGVLAGNYFVQYLDRKSMSDRRFMLALAFVLMYSYVAEVIGLSAIVGAFLAGVIINRSQHISHIEERTVGLELVFMPIFFITLGILIDVNALVTYALPILVITILAIVSKAVACTGAALLSKLDFKQSLIVGIGMVPRGEVALIIASIGFTSGVLNSSEYSIISAMALLTTFVVPPILTKLLKEKGKIENQTPQVSGA